MEFVTIVSNFGASDLLVVICVQSSRLMLYIEMITGYRKKIKSHKIYKHLFLKTR